MNLLSAGEAQQGATAQVGSVSTSSIVPSLIVLQDNLKNSRHTVTQKMHECHYIL